MIFDEMYNASSHILEKILNQPFNVELANGTLPKEKFIFYLTQDALYLADFSRALALTAARLTCNHHTHQFIKFALGAIEAERELHTNYLAEHSHINLQSQEQGPACFMYTNFLLRTASIASIEEAVASLLPCFWIYHEVGKFIEVNNHRDHPYREWINLYSSETFHQTVQLAINTTNELSLSASIPLKQSMIATFIRSAELEWIFWEGAYRQEARFIIA